MKKYAVNGGTSTPSNIGRRSAVNALGSALGMFALSSCSARAPQGHDSEEEAVGRTSEALVGDSALLTSGTIAAGSGALAFPNFIVNGWRNYELRLRNLFPQSAPAAGAFLALHVSTDNGVTYDCSSCNTSDCSQSGHYSFTNAFTVPGGSTVLSRNSALGGGAYDKQFELAQQGAQASGLCGTVRFSDPLANGIFKQFEWDTSYFGPNNFCRESGGGLYYGNTIPTNGAPFNAFRLMYTNANGASVNPGGAQYLFGGGSYSLWAFT